MTAIKAELRYRGKPIPALSMIELQHGLKFAQDAAGDLQRRMSNFAIPPRNGKEQLQLYLDTASALKAELEARKNSNDI